MKPINRKLIDYVRQTVDPGFFSIFTYDQHAVRACSKKEALPDTLIGPMLDDFIHRRVRLGDGIRRVANLCKTANSKGFSLLLLIDEPQFWRQRDRLVENDEG